MGKWIRNHKFWSSVIILFIIGCILSMIGIVDAFNGGRLLGWYIFIGGIIWAIDRRRSKKETKEGSK